MNCISTAIGEETLRNRFYHARLGRFITPDPNSSAIPLIEGATFHGQPPTALALVTSGAVSEYSPTAQYGDGMSLYGYHNSSPVNLLDMLGLSDDFDWFDEGEDIIAEIQGERAAMADMYYNLGIAGMDVMGAAAVAAFQVMVTVYVPGGGLLVSGWNTYESIEDVYENGLGFWNGLSLGLNGAAFVGEVAGAIGKFTEAFQAAKLRYTKGARLAANAARGAQYEEYVRTTLGLAKNTTRIVHDGITAIPDAITATEVIEIKDVVKISLSPQLKAIGGWAARNGKTAVLYVSERNTYISSKVTKLFEVRPILR